MDAAACGNIGRPFPETAREGHDVLVVEVSSFQLAVQESFHPKVSVLLNVAPDHLDWHGGESAYREAKARIYAQQGAGDTHVGNRDDPASARLTEAAPCEVVWFRSGAPVPGEVGYEKDQLVARRDDGRDELGVIDGTRAGYREDAAAAAAAALAFGAGSAAVRRGLADFLPAPHRGEEVARIDGVVFLDNSKATNVHAVLAALAAAPKGAVLIAGGRAKGQDLSPLRSAAGALAGVVVIGEAADELAVVFEGALPVRRADTLEGAVATAFELASHPGTVLLAPACASWDMFRDYAERGDVFAAAARALGRAHAGS
jgi:UDP-N-acetylmuramoylalanine--D-glutamate ligase